MLFTLSGLLQSRLDQREQFTIPDAMRLCNRTCIRSEIISAFVLLTHDVVDNRVNVAVKFLIWSHDNLRFVHCYLLRMSLNYAMLRQHQYTYTNLQLSIVSSIRVGPGKHTYQPRIVLASALMSTCQSPVCSQIVVENVSHLTWVGHKKGDYCESPLCPPCVLGLRVACCHLRQSLRFACRYGFRAILAACLRL